MKALKIFLWIFLGALAETCLSRYIGIWGIIPSLVFVFCICFCSMDESFYTALAVSLAGGICMGALSGTEMWFSILKFTYTGVLCSVMTNNLFKRKKFFFTVIAVTLLMSFVSEFMYYLMNMHSISLSGIASAVLWVSLPAAVYNTVIALIFYMPVKLTFYRRIKKDIIKSIIATTFFKLVLHSFHTYFLTIISNY